MDTEDAASLVSVNSLNPSPSTITKLVKRLRAMMFVLLPVQVDPEDIKKPSSWIITPEVIASVRAAAGDYQEALPYALLRARQIFVWQANRNPADFDEHWCRATACEVLARRIVHLTPPDRLPSLMSKRYRHIAHDGDASALASALELAIDQHCTIFLSSSEAQQVVNSLWRGEWIQVNNEKNDIDYVPFDVNGNENSFGTHFHPSRLAVPRYQNFFRIAIWVFYLFVYSQAVQQPVERREDSYRDMDTWEIILYVMALAFSFEEIHKIYKILRYFSYRAFGFWTVISILTDSLLMTAFVLRVLSLITRRNGSNDGGSLVVNNVGEIAMNGMDYVLKTGSFEGINYHYLSFQVLSFVSPFIWMKLITVADGFKYVGTMQICVGRMLQESSIFFLLLSIMAFGFAQGLYALDSADGVANHGLEVMNALIQALLQAPVFEGAAVGSGSALGLYYLWNVTTGIILLNILISLFSSAYDDVIHDAEAHFLAFFAAKTVGMIRAPDSFVYPAPFSLIEILLVSPFELFLDKKSYAKLNQRVMTIVFFIPLAVIALWESVVEHGSLKKRYMHSWLGPVWSDEEDSEEIRNPKVYPGEDDEHRDGHEGHHGTSGLVSGGVGGGGIIMEGGEGLQISKVKFEELTSVFPNAALSPEAVISNEIRELKEMILALERKLDAEA